MAFIRILIVDDHDIVRLGIRRLLEDVDGIEVVGEVNSGEEAIKMARELDVHVVLMDVRMPGIGGLEATRRMVKSNPNIKIIALTVCDDEPFPSKLFQAGAAGYLTKGSSLEEMVRAINDVNSGKRYVSPEVAQQLALKSITDSKKSPLDILSERELQIMIMITSGKKVQEISDNLCLSSKTVNSYRYRLFDKLNINSDVELTHLAIKYGILDSPKEYS